MARSVTPAQTAQLRRPKPLSDPMQPIFAETGPTKSLRPVPSLAALEQTGGPELDERLELPTREAWSTRLSKDLFKE